MDAPFKPCSVDGCQANAHYRAKGVKGRCSVHNARFNRTGSFERTRRGYTKGAASCRVCGSTKGRITMGLCSSHYHRLCRHGNPIEGAAPRPERGEPLQYLIEHMYDGCSFPWPFATCGGGAGYPQINIDGTKTTANRFVCELVNGPPPTPDHEAAHSCGNQSCFHAGCLRWATSSENNMDKVDHGTHNRGERHSLAKISEATAHYIKFSAPRTSATTLARSIGVSATIIRHIWAERSWCWLRKNGETKC